MTPLLFVRAAERADLNATLAERSLESLAIAPNLPCVLVLEHGQSCILWDVRDPKGSPKRDKNDKSVTVNGETRFLVQFPETQDDKQVMTLAELKPLYTGYAFFVRPVARRDERAGPAEIQEGRDWFWGVLKKNKTLYSEVIVAAVIINLFGIAGSIFIMNVYDRVVPNNAFDTLWVLSAGVCIVYFFDFFLRNLRAVDLPFVFLFILIIAVIGGPVAFVPLAAVPVIVGMGFLLQGPLEKVIRQSLHENALKNALLFETIIGLETIKAQAAEGHKQRTWEELTDKVQQLVSVFIVIVGVFLISEGDLSMGALIACVILSGRAMGPLAQVAGLMIRYNQTKHALDQLNDLMARPVERPVGKHFVSMPSMKGQVEFRDISFHYPGQTTPALGDINFNIAPGEHVGIIGAVGSGKTTIERLLINLYQPSNGSVQIDGSSKSRRIIWRDGVSWRFSSWS